MTLTSASIGERLKTAGPVVQDLDAVWSALWRQAHVPASTLELCRLLLARRHQAEAELKLRMPGTGVAEDKIAALIAEKWGSDPRFTEAERAALDFTEYFHVDSQNIPDEEANAVIRHFGENGLVALIEALCFTDGRLRLALVFNKL